MPSPLLTRSVLRAPGGFHPLKLGATLTNWWRADDLADGAVSSWADAVSGLTVEQATGANQPVKGSTSLPVGATPYFPGVTFDGVDDNMRVDAVTGLPTGATEGWIFLVMTSVEDASAHIAFAYGSTANGTFRRMNKNTTNNMAAQDGTSVATSSITLGTTSALIGGNHTDGNYHIWQNGARVGTVGSTTLNTGTLRTSIGSGNGAAPASFWNGVIRHVLVTTALTIAQRQKLEGWLAWDSRMQGALPSGHPYRTVRP